MLLGIKRIKIMNRTIIDGIECIVLYHGTSAINVTNIMDSPMMKQSLNGLGFYLTDEVDTAKQYGSKVIAFAMTRETYESIKFVVRTIDLSWSEGLTPYGLARTTGIEYVVTTQGGVNALAVECEDTYLV